MIYVRENTVYNTYHFHRLNAKAIMLDLLDGVSTECSPSTFQGFLKYSGGRYRSLLVLVTSSPETLQSLRTQSPLTLLLVCTVTPIRWGCAHHHKSWPEFQSLISTFAQRWHIHCAYSHRRDIVTTVNSVALSGVNLCPT